MAEDTMRKFHATREDGTLVWLAVRKPTRQETDIADLELSSKYNQCLLAGLPTRAKMARELRKKGNWPVENEAKFAAIREEGIALEKQIEADKFETPEAKSKVKNRHEEILNQLNEIRSDVDALLARTADALADESREQFLIAATVEFAEFDGDGQPTNNKNGGERLWDSVELFLDDKDERLKSRVYYEYTMFVNNQISRWDQLMASLEPAPTPPAKTDADTPAPETPAVVADVVTAPAEPVSAVPSLFETAAAPV